MPVALIDVLAAHQLKEGLLLALLRKQQHGQLVSVSLYDAAICSLANQASNFLMAQHIPQRIGSLHPNIAPYGEIFQTKDGKQVTFAVGSNAHFVKLCQVLNLSDLHRDPRFLNNIDRVKNRTILAQLLQEKVALFEAIPLIEAYIQIGVPAALIKDLADVFETPEAQMLVKTEAVNGIDTKRVTQIAFQIHDSNT